MTVATVLDQAALPACSPAARDWDSADDPDWYWYICRAQKAALSWPKPGTFSKEEYLGRLGRSSLTTSALRTMVTMTDFATSRGVTTVDRATISQAVGKSEWTVTQHWNMARRLGLLTTRRRFDSSSVQHLLVSDDSACPLDEEVQDIRAHEWSDAELLWWASIGTTEQLPAPWGEQQAPY